jgi:hypothetical protein
MSTIFYVVFWAFFSPPNLPAASTLLFRAPAHLARIVVVSLQAFGLSPFKTARR